MAEGKAEKKTTKKPTKRTNDKAPRRPTQEKRKQFAREYIVDFNITKAAHRCGVPSCSAHSTGYRWYRDDETQGLIREELQKRAERTEITADKVLAYWWDMANADVNELMEYRRHCCRFCYGTDHNYQWRNEAEWENAVASAEANEQMPPDNEGGYGFTELVDPAPDCPRCEGGGVPDIRIKDTRYLSPGARMLFDGIKQTKDGLEIKVRDRDKALENVAKHLGMFKQEMRLGVDEESPLAALINAVSGNTLKPRDDED